MTTRTSLIALVVAVGAAGAMAAIPAQSTQSPPAPVSEQKPVQGETDPKAQLPPNHPPIDGKHAGAMHATDPGAYAPPASDEPVPIKWTVPASWKTAENPSTMRLATYHVPHAGKDAEDAEISVVRAGGSVEANAQRWIGQFDNAGQDTRDERTVHGMKITVVEVSGTYLGGGMGGKPERHEGYSLLGAIVETPGSPTFFKMIGPTATVKSAKKDFAKMLDGIAPAT